MTPHPVSSPAAVTRRTLLQQAGMGALSLAAFPPTLLSAEATTKAAAPALNDPAASVPPGELPLLNRFGRMMQEYYVARLRDVERAANARRAALRTRADAEACVREVRRKAQQCFGPWPAKTPLNARVTGIVERDTYRIEKVIFESRPGFPVTANLYIPKGRGGKLPGAVGTCGHSLDGKADRNYQSFAQGLAGLGYICLIYDPFGQGERLQCVGPNFKPRHGIGVTEHLHVGNQQVLVGEFSGAWMAWDGIRALDYLASATVFTATRDLARSLAARRARPEGAALRRAVVAALKLPARDAATPPDYRILRPSAGRRYPKRFAGTYAVETEPGIHAIVYRLSDVALYSRPARDLKRAILYVAHHSSDAELRNEPLIAELMTAEPAAAVFACDVRGVGESQPTTTSDGHLARAGSDYFYAVHGLMLDAPYIGQRTHDVLRVVDWLRGCGHAEIHLVARGWGAIPATFAAVISDGVTQVTLKNALTSYDDIATNEAYRWPLSCLVPDILKTFDLPDCYRALAVKKLRQVDPWGAMAG